MHKISNECTSKHFCLPLAESVFYMPPTRSLHKIFTISEPYLQAVIYSELIQFKIFSRKICFRSSWNHFTYMGGNYKPFSIRMPTCIQDMYVRLYAVQCGKLEDVFFFYLLILVYSSYMYINVCVQEQKNRILKGKIRFRTNKRVNDRNIQLQVTSIGICVQTNKDFVFKVNICFHFHFDKSLFGLLCSAVHWRNFFFKFSFYSLGQH